MKYFYFIYLAISEFKTHRKRFLLTSLAIGWGIMAILMLLAIGEGLKKQLLKGQKGIGENIMILWGGQTSYPYQGLPTGRRIRFIPEDVELIKESVPEIKAISGEYHQWGVAASVGKIQRSILVCGANSSFGEIRNQIPNWGSRFLHPGDIKAKNRVVFIGWEVAKNFFANQDPVGKQIIIEKIPFTIVGVLKEKMQMGNYNNMDSQKSYIPEDVFFSMFGHRYYSNLVFSLKDASQTEYVKARVYQILGKKYQFDPNDKMALSFWDVVEMHKQTNKMLSGIQIFMGFIGFLTLVISGVGLTNIMYVSIKRRTQEIGVKIALGANPKQILGQIITESFIFSLIGGIGGALLSVFLVSMIRMIPKNNEALFLLTAPKISIEIAMIVALILTIITFLAGFFPARKAAAQNPIDSLRYE